MKHRWKRKPKNAPDADTTVRYIESIKKKCGLTNITERIIVQESRRKKSLLHNCFEWDNIKAANSWRLEQARKILACLVVVVEGDDDEVLYVRKYVAQSELGEDTGSGYISITKIRSDEELNKTYIKQLYRELQEMKYKLRAYKVFASVVSAIEAVKI